MAKRKQNHLEIVPRNLARMKFDIQEWISAKDMFLNVIQPRNYKIQQIFKRVAEDDMVLSQTQKIRRGILRRVFVLKNQDGSINEEETQKLYNSKIYAELTRACWEAEFYIYSLIEFNYDKDGQIEVKFIDRENVVPQAGIFYKDFGIYDGIKYRDLPDFGTWILEFRGCTAPLGILNSCSPKFIMKNFAMSCWAEFTQIYGIPPRIMKTDTSDYESLNRAEDMMNAMGTAAYAIIDNSEDFSFAQGITSNGDVYDKLITKCDNANAMTIASAIVGMDTKNGSNSKEITSKEITDELIESYLKEIQQAFNGKIMKALYDIGFFGSLLKFEYTKTIDLNQLWTFVKDLLPYKNFSNEWLNQTFGIIAEDKPATTTGAALHSDFFV